MYKRILCLLFAALLLLSGCSIREKGQTESTTQETTEQSAQTRPEQFSDDPELAAVWVNAGQYSEGQDFVETMSLFGDGTVIIHLEYQGKDYETLTGTYTALQGVLTVSIDAEESYQKYYQYELSANVLTLYGNDKTVVYRRSD